MITEELFFAFTHDSESVKRTNKVRRVLFHSFFHELDFAGVAQGVEKHELAVGLRNEQKDMGRIILMHRKYSLSVALMILIGFLTDLL